MFNHHVPLNKQQGDSEISENPVSQKKCFEKMFSVKEYSWNENYLLFELSRRTNFDINLFVKDFEKLMNLINKCQLCK